MGLRAWEGRYVRALYLKPHRRGRAVHLMVSADVDRKSTQPIFDHMISVQFEDSGSPALARIGRGPGERK